MLTTGDCMSYWGLRQVLDYQNIFGCEVFFEEFKALYKKDPSTARKYQKWLDRQFGMLSRTPINSLLSYPSFANTFNSTAN